MSLLIKSRTAQWPLVQEFTFNYDDTMLNTAGVSHDFVTAAAHAFDVIPLPVGAIVIGGEIVTETAFNNVTTLAVIVGDSGSTNRYLSTADRKGAARVALVPTGFVGAGENIRLTVTPTWGGAPTTGKFTLRVEYIIRGRSNEVQIT